MAKPGEVSVHAGATMAALLAQLAALQAENLKLKEGTSRELAWEVSTKGQIHLTGVKGSFRGGIYLTVVGLRQVLAASPELTAFLDTKCAEEVSSGKAIFSRSAAEATAMDKAWEIANPVLAAQRKLKREEWAAKNP